MERTELENELAEHCTYTFYTDILGGVSIPDEASFNRCKETAVQQVLNLAPVLTENSTFGAVKAVCKMAEVQYTDEQTASGESSAAPESESVGGYSYGAGTATRLAQEKNFKTTEQKQLFYLNLYCTLQKAVL